MPLSSVAREGRYAWRRLIGNKGFSRRCVPIRLEVGVHAVGLLRVGAAHRSVSASSGARSGGMIHTVILDGQNYSPDLIRGLPRLSRANAGVVGAGSVQRGERGGGKQRLGGRRAGVLRRAISSTVLAAHLVRGRVLTPADDSAPTANAVAVISERIWRTQLNASPNVVGSIWVYFTRRERGRAIRRTGGPGGPLQGRRAPPHDPAVRRSRRCSRRCRSRRGFLTDGGRAQGSTV